MISERNRKELADSASCWWISFSYVSSRSGSLLLRAESSNYRDFTPSRPSDLPISSHASEYKRTLEFSDAGRTQEAFLKRRPRVVLFFFAEWTSGAPIFRERFFFSKLAARCMMQNCGHASRMRCSADHGQSTAWPRDWRNAWECTMANASGIPVIYADLSLARNRTLPRHPRVDNYSRHAPRVFESS